jgi:hypothetical protein
MPYTPKGGALRWLATSGWHESRTTDTIHKYLICLVVATFLKMTQIFRIIYTDFLLSSRNEERCMDMASKSVFCPCLRWRCTIPLL